MAKKNEEINIISEEVQDIMSKIPNSLIRYGLTGMFIFILLIVFISWFVKYPDIINGEIVLTTTKEPILIVSQSSGTLKKLFVKDGDFVNAGKSLGEIENPLATTTVDYLQVYLNNLEIELNNNQKSLTLPDTTIGSFGDLQNYINGLMKELLQYNLSFNYKMDDEEINSIRIKIENQKALIAVNNNIISITRKELENAKIKIDADEKLYKDSVFSKMEYFQLKSSYSAKELDLENKNLDQINQKNILEALNYEYKQSEFKKQSQRESNIAAINGDIKSIRSYLIGWQQQYKLTAMKSGKVNFLNRFQTGDYIKSGEEIFAITDTSGVYMGIVTIESYGYGKVKVGQDVHILLQSYPYYEYGMIRGKVNKVAVFPNTNQYKIEVSLPDGMMSTQHHLLKYSPEMKGEAEIITDDKRILERVFESIAKILKRK